MSERHCQEWRKLNLLKYLCFPPKVSLLSGMQRLLGPPRSLVYGEESTGTGNFFFLSQNFKPIDQVMLGVQREGRQREFWGEQGEAHRRDYWGRAEGLHTPLCLPMRWSCKEDWYLASKKWSREAAANGHGHSGAREAGHRWCAKMSTPYMWWQVVKKVKREALSAGPLFLLALALTPNPLPFCGEPSTYWNLILPSRSSLSAIFSAKSVPFTLAPYSAPSQNSSHSDRWPPAEKHLKS